MTAGVFGSITPAGDTAGFMGSESYETDGGLLTLT